MKTPLILLEREPVSLTTNLPLRKGPTAITPRRITILRATCQVTHWPVFTGQAARINPFWPSHGPVILPPASRGPRGV